MTCPTGERVRRANCRTCCQIAEEEAARVPETVVTIQTIASEVWSRYPELGLKMDSIPPLDPARVERVRADIGRLVPGATTNGYAIYIPAGLRVEKLVARFRSHWFKEFPKTMERIKRAIGDSPVEKGYWTVLTDVVLYKMSRLEVDAALSSHSFERSSSLSALALACIVHDLYKKNVFERRLRCIGSDSLSATYAHRGAYARCREESDGIDVVLGTHPDILNREETFLLTDRHIVDPLLLGVCAERVLSPD